MLLIASEVLKGLDQLKASMDTVVGQVQRQVRSVRAKVKTVLTQLERSVEHFMKQEEVIDEDVIE